MRIYNTTTNQPDSIIDAIDAINGTTWTLDLIGDDNNIHYNDNLGRYETGQDTIDYWDDLIQRLNASDKAKCDYLATIDDYYDHEYAQRYIEEQCNCCDLEDQPEAILQAIEELKLAD